jgi:hypothetical protein
MEISESINQFLKEGKTGARLRVAEQLYLRKGLNGRSSASWTFRFMWRRGQQSEIGLGSLSGMSPDIAEVIAARCRAQVKMGYWPGTGPGPRPRPAPEIKAIEPVEAPQCVAADPP